MNAADPYGTLARIEERRAFERRLKPAARYFSTPGVVPAQEPAHITAAEAIRRVKPAPKRALHPEADAVVAAVCEAYDVLPERILYRERGPTGAQCRAATYRLLHLRYGWTPARIAEEFCCERSGVRKMIARAQGLWAARSGQWRKRYHAAQMALEQ